MFKRRVDKTDTMHQIYSNQKIKQQLIDFIYDTTDIGKFKYIILENKTDLQLLTTAKYFVSPNYVGSSSLLVFTKSRDRFYSFVVDRKTLTYSKQRINIDNVNVIPVELGLDESIYDGTIIDGILSQRDDKKVFIITDIYLFRGDDLSNDQIKYKLINVQIYLDKFLSPDKNLNNIELKVNKLYELPDTKMLCDTIIPKEKQLQIRGIVFYPVVSGNKLIFLFARQQHNMETPKQDHEVFRHKHSFNTNNYNEQQKEHNSSDEQNNQSYEHENHKNTVRYICKTDKPIILTFELRRTEQVDIYKMILIEKSKNNGKDILKIKKVGIACIPTMELSKMCRELTLDTGRVLMKCKYDTSREKWVPIEKDTKSKHPDFIDALEKKMDIVYDDE